MPTLSWTQRRENGVTLVEATIESERPSGRTAVVVESTLDGPVWPPRSEGVPISGWNDDRYETILDAPGRVAVGFASPSEPEEPPIELVETEPVGEDSATSVTRDSTAEVDPEPADVLRALGDPTPPRSAVPSSVPADSLPTAPDADEPTR